MDWVVANWFWILVFVLFIVMHLFGHGGHGGHGEHRHADAGEKDEQRERVVNQGPSEHQH